MREAVAKQSEYNRPRRTIRKPQRLIETMKLNPVYIYIFIDVIDTQLSERKGRCYDTDRTLIRVFEQPKHPSS